ncbi:MAG: hypothetical protein CW691_06330 [Candidatus Bathyarchaeum sp.]|nr:MAG: hypothetical protein CW691_06330 [Candidatus Bathyarchaeum sp.]
MPLNNSTAQHKKKTRGCSFRINEESLKILNEEADTQGISVNALMNKILKQYINQFRHIKRFGAVITARTVFNKIVDCCTEDELKKIAEVTGSTETKDAMRTLGIPQTYDTVIAHIKMAGTHGGWFDFNQHTKNSGEYIHLRHELGKKWSTFLAETVSSIFKSILDIEVKTEILDNYVTIQIPK